MMSGLEISQGTICPDRACLTEYSLGRLSLAELQAVSQHIDQCSHCEATLSTLGPREDSLVQKLRGPEFSWRYVHESEFERMATFARHVDLKEIRALSGTAALRQAAKRADYVLPSGTEIGQYTIVERIGRGGMGSVYKARHRSLERLVAIKLLRGEGEPDQQSLLRFQREMVAIGKLDSPYVVRATDAGQASGLHYLVMELVAGTDVACIVRDGRQLTVADACEIARQAALGLQDIAACQLVHRDIKPSNLILDVTGRVKILDLGLAFLHQHPLSDAHHTYEGSILGTVDYVAPEQVENTRGVDIRADIYSLGCTLYHLLAGVPPFSGPAYDSPIKKIVAHSRDHAPSFESFRADIPPALSQLVTRMMEKDPANRMTSPQELVAALEPFVSGANLVELVRTNPTSTDSSSSNDFSTSRSQSAFIETAPLPTKQTPIEKHLTEPVAVAQAGRGSSRRILFIAGGILGTLILLAAVIAKIKTPDGTLIVTVNEPDAQVQVLNDEGKVEITRKGDKEPIKIAVDSGKHRLRVTKDGFEIFVQEFSIASEGREAITAKLVPLAEQPSVTGSKPATVVSESPGPLFFQTPEYETWAKEVAAMPAEKQLEAISQKLIDLNPGFDGKLVSTVPGISEPIVENGGITSLGFFSDNVTDVSPIRALSSLRALSIAGSGPGKSKLIDLQPLSGLSLSTLFMAFTQVSDLSPLERMPLEELDISSTNISDLSQLKDMKLVKLYCFLNPSITDLSPLAGMPLKLLQIESSKVADLSPLHGMPLEHLSIDYTQVSSLAPLKGMPLKGLGIGGDTVLVNDLSPLQGMHLTELRMHGSLVTDLSVLDGMPLELLNIAKTTITDLTPLRSAPLKSLEISFSPQCDVALLRSIKSLETVNEKPAAEFYKKIENYQAEMKKSLAFESPEFDQWVKETSDLTANDQLKAVAEKLMKLNPGFDGKLMRSFEGDSPTIENGKVTELRFFTDHVTDISPVRVFKSLSYLNISGSALGKGKLISLKPLRGLPLPRLDCYFTRVSDLSPLEGMELSDLNVSNSLVTDLSPLHNMPLKVLYLTGVPVHDLTPLKGLPLKILAINHTNVTDLSALNGTSIQTLDCQHSKVRDISAIKSLPLQHFSLDYRPERDSEILRSIKTLKLVNEKPVAEFWQEAEASD